MATVQDPVATHLITARECERLAVLLDGSPGAALNVYADGSAILAFDNSASDVSWPAPT